MNEVRLLAAAFMLIVSLGTLGLREHTQVRVACFQGADFDCGQTPEPAQPTETLVPTIPAPTATIVPTAPAPLDHFVYIPLLISVPCADLVACMCDAAWVDCSGCVFAPNSGDGVPLCQ